MRGRNDYENKISKEIAQEIFADHPIRKHISAIRFVSKSKGRRRKRKNWKEIVFIRYGSSKSWRSWSGEDRHDKGRIPWDKWAQEIYGYDISEDDFRKEFLKLLSMGKGKF